MVGRLMTSRVAGAKAGAVAGRTRRPVAARSGRAAATVPLVPLQQLLVLRPLVGRENFLRLAHGVVERRTPLLVELFHLPRVRVLNLLEFVLVLRPNERRDRVLTLLAEL